jgi:hypothetical protein
VTARLATSNPRLATSCRRVAASKRRRALLAGAAALALGLSACGHKQAHPTNVDDEGVYVDAGPLTYQVQISRQLNPFNVEDKEYLNGITASPAKPDEMWFAVFLWSKNESHAPQTTTTRFAIVDTSGNTYYPLPINPAVNPYAWTAQTLRPNGTEPTSDSTAFFGPTQGGELLFKLNNSVYSNRPLTLLIYAPGQAKPSSVSLDL